MKRWLIVGLGLLAAEPALAEEAEMVIGATAGVFLPVFESQSPDFGGWTAGGHAQYGITPDLALGLAFEVSPFSGEVSDHTLTSGGQSYTGELRFNGMLYHPQLTVEYKVYAGYDLAPYVEASVGYAWATYGDRVLVNENNQSYGLDIEDLQEGSVTVSIALTVDVRVLNLIMVGIAPRYTYLPSGMLRHVVTIPITVAYYW